MIGKRKDFIDRLLRISQINEQLIDIGDKYRQPAYTKRIRLVQMGRAEVILPNNIAHHSSVNANCKILIIDKRQQKYHSCNNVRTKTANLQDNQSQSVQTSPQKSQHSNFKHLLDKKLSIRTFNQNQNQDINFVSPVNVENKNRAYQKQQIQIKRVYSASKRAVSEPKCRIIPKDNHSQRFFQQEINKTGFVTGKSMRVQRTYTPSLQRYQRQNKVEQDKKAKLLAMKQISKMYAKPFSPPPKISAKSYIISQVLPETMKVVVSSNSRNAQEVASLTKIMTCILTIQLCQRQNIDIDKEQVKIGKYQCNIGGTSAELKPSQIYTIRQLLYGLMLPSGNDASLALAVWSGRKLLQLFPEEQKMGKSTTQSSSNTLIPSFPAKLTKCTCYARFVRQMNDKAKQLNMSKTRYVNSHGLSNQNNKSTAYDISLLCYYAIKNSLFREIVSCKVYQTVIKSQFEIKEPIKSSEAMQTCMVGSEASIQELIEQRNCDSPDISQVSFSKQKIASCKLIQTVKLQAIKIKWQNTHRLLLFKSDQYLGIKTGVTTTAGACLSSLLKIQNRQFLIIVLACSKLSLRFKQTQILKRWLYKHEGIARKVKKLHIQLQNCKQQSASDSQQNQSKQND